MAAENHNAHQDPVKKLTKSYHHVPREFPFFGLTVGQHFIQAADVYRDKEMFVFYSDNERITFEQMKEQSQQFAASLVTKGMKRGDRMALWGANHLEWLVAFFACTQLGILLVQFRLEFPLLTMSVLLKKLQCKALLITRSPDDIVHNACKLIPELQSDNQEDFSSFPDLKLIIYGDESKTTSEHILSRNAFTLSDFKALGSNADKENVTDICWTVDIDDPCLVYFTSGTTGIPKPTMISHHSLLNNAATIGAFRAGVDGFDENWDSVRFALTLSFAGSASFPAVFLPQVRGCTTVILYPTYNADTMAKALQDEKVTEGLFFINHMNDLVNLPNINDYDFSNLRMVCTGGSTIPKKLREKLNRIVKYRTNIFGMSETEGVFISHPLDPHGDDALYPVGGVEVKIVDDEGSIVPINTQGEIHIRSYCLFMCYLGEPEKTSEARDANGWLHTCDIAEMDQNGFLRMRGRKKELIIKEAFNLSPSELEATLYKLSGILGAMVVGVPDARTGEEICACVRVEKENSPTSEEIAEFCKGKVVSQLVPKYVLFVDDFPTTETGKFSRKKMAETATETLGIKKFE